MFVAACMWNNRFLTRIVWICFIEWPIAMIKGEPFNVISTWASLFQYEYETCSDQPSEYNSNLYTKNYQRLSFCNTNLFVQFSSPDTDHLWGKTMLWNFHLTLLYRSVWFPFISTMHLEFLFFSLIQHSSSQILRVIRLTKY